MIKKYISSLIVCALTICQCIAQNWTTVTKTNPAYHFSFPGTPNIMDTLNIRFANYQSDSMEVFQVLEFKDTPLDSANTSFMNELKATNGDTLLSIAQSASLANNAVITSSQNITSFPAFKGLEVCMRYNDLYSGRVLIAYTQFFLIFIP
jgi:hypothetical protein